MKTKNQTTSRSILRMLFIAALFMFAAGTTNAQNKETTMQDIYEKGLEIVKMLEEQYNQEIVRIEYDLLFDSKETTRGFSSDYEYSVIAFSDFRVEDLDITIFRKSGSSWEQVVKDTETDNTPIVSFKPDGSSTYKIEVKAYKFAEGYSAAHYGLIIYHDIPE